MGVRNASIIQSLCLQNIQILTKTFFKQKNPTGVRNASIIQPLHSQNIQTISQSHSSFLKLCKLPKIRDLGKQRERSLCSLKIKISNKLTNQLNPQQNFNKNAFQT